MSNFKADIIDLFSHQRGGHVQQYCYGDDLRPDGSTGSSAWRDFIVAANNYYPTGGEIDLIPRLIKEISNDHDAIIDLGIGSESAVIGKTAPIIRSQPRLKTYTAIDVSAEELAGGLEHIRGRFQSLRTRAIQGDFYQSIKGIEGDNRLGLLLGTTISNQDMMVGGTLPRDIIVERLAMLGDNVRGEDKDGHLIVSVDANTDLKAAAVAYSHPSFARIMTGMMYDVQSKIAPVGDFKPSMWHFTPVIDVDNYVVQLVISPSVDQKFSIDHHEFDLKKGEQFVVVNCFKFPIDMFAEMLKDAGLTNGKSPVASQDHPMVFFEAAV